MSGMNHYLLWRGPPMERSLPALLPIRAVKGDWGRWGERERGECAWERKTHRILLISLQILQCSIFAGVCSRLQRTFVHVISTLTLQEAKLGWSSAGQTNTVRAIRRVHYLRNCFNSCKSRRQDTALEWIWAPNNKTWLLTFNTANDNSQRKTRGHLPGPQIDKNPKVNSPSAPCWNWQRENLNTYIKLVLKQKWAI